MKIFLIGRRDDSTVYCQKKVKGLKLNKLTNNQLKSVLKDLRKEFNLDSIQCVLPIKNQLTLLEKQSNKRGLVLWAKTTKKK